METFEGLIRRIVKSFNAAGLDYMFTGALAASYYGTPRTTMDADVVIRGPSRKGTQTQLVSALKKAGLQVEEERIDAALSSGFKIATFNDSRSPFTLDMIFSSRRLEKRAGKISGLPTFYQTPEELILAKLRMIKATVPRERALKDEGDVKAILRFTEVDMNAIKRRARRNGTLHALESVLEKNSGLG